MDEIRSRRSLVPTLCGVLASVSLLVALQQLAIWWHGEQGAIVESNLSNLASVPRSVLDAARAALPGCEPVLASRFSSDGAPGYAIEFRDEKDNRRIVLISQNRSIWMWRRADRGEITSWEMLAVLDEHEVPIERALAISHATPHGDSPIAWPLGRTWRRSLLAAALALALGLLGLAIAIWGRLKAASRSERVDTPKPE